MGVRIAIDDFGTGYSALSTAQFPIDVLKDRQVVIDDMLGLLPSQSAWSTRSSGWPAQPWDLVVIADEGIRDRGTPRRTARMAA